MRVCNFRVVNVTDGYVKTHFTSSTKAETYAKELSEKDGKKYTIMEDSMDSALRKLFITEN